MISAFDLYKVGIGPSSSHTVGPMRAANIFVTRLASEGLLDETAGLHAEMFGSLGVTGHGHGTVKAVILGLEGEQPHLVDPANAEPRVEAVRTDKVLRLGGKHPISFSLDDDLILHRRKRLPFHSNGMRFTASDADGHALMTREYFSVGGGFVLDEDEIERSDITADDKQRPVPYPFSSGDELLQRTRETGLSISELMLANELTRRGEEEIRSGLLHIWSVMQDCVNRGIYGTGILPGGLKVRRRAGLLRQILEATDDSNDPLRAMEWITLYALAVNDFIDSYSEDGVVRFLLTAAAVGILFKENASISGAEVGCQGEVGSACSMAAAGLAEVLGGTPDQVENAAEIGIEHNLGLTCDPIGGLVQIPCIERNAVGSIKAITAARMAVRGDGEQFVSLDKAIKTMRDTGADMKDKYKETARGGLAVNVIEC
jgi:L-serine dehydratase